MPEGHPTDVIVDDLARTYQAGAARLAGIVQAGLRRGLDPTRAGGISAVAGDATLAYRERQLRAAAAVLDELRQAGRVHAPAVAARAYGAGLVAVDRTALGELGELRPRFGGIHARAVDALAANMTGSLERAVTRAGDNVARVFARASALEGGLPARGGPGRAVSFIGRRTDDPWRRVGLDETATGLVALDTRRQVTTSMVRRLVNDGVSDALTGFVDRSGRRWALDRYAAMVARTTTREAVSRGAVNRLTEHGLDLVTISSHPHAADECDAYDGQTFSLDGNTPGYDVLDTLPPFHPNCAHVLTPAAANLDDYLSELEQASAETAPAPAKVPPARAGEVSPPPAQPAPDLHDAMQKRGGPTEEAANDLWKNELSDDPLVDSWLHGFSGTPRLDAAVRGIGSAEDIARAGELTGRLMEPTRAAIRRELGDTVRLYRVERPGPVVDRALYSYTANPRAARAMAHAEEKAILRADDVDVRDMALVVYQRDKGYTEVIVNRRAADARRSPRPPAGADAPPPFGPRARAHTDAASAARLEAQERRALIEGDPGPDVEAELARDREHDRIGKLEKRARNKYVKDNLGEDLAHFTGLKWAETAGPRGLSIHDAFVAGDLTVDEVEAMALDEYNAREYRAAMRDRRKQEAGFRTGSIPCFVCGRRKPRPSAVCAFCGDDPVTYGGSAHDFDRAYGYSGAGDDEFGKAAHERRLGG